MQASRYNFDIFVWGVCCLLLCFPVLLLFKKEHCCDVISYKFIHICSANATGLILCNVYGNSLILP